MRCCLNYDSKQIMYGRKNSIIEEFWQVIYYIYISVINIVPILCHPTLMVKR